MTTATTETPANPILAARRWGFLGAGKMATAMIQGMIRAGTPCGQILAGDVQPAARAALASATGVATQATNAEVVRGCDVVILAVKPQAMPAVLAEVAPLLSADHLIISIAAGVTIRTISEAIGPGRRIARVMPNTPALVGAGASAFCLGPDAASGDEEVVRTLMEAVGRAYPVAEPLMDAVTGLSGGGPAYVYAMIEALSDGGVRVGLPREVATALAAQTLLGAARMVLETGLHPGVLKDQVTSPGGTTIAGLHALERGRMRASLMDAVEAATSRSAELGAPAKAATP